MKPEPAMSKSKKSLRERTIDAEVMASRYLADANEAAEQGNKKKEEKLLAKCQFWLDRYNKLAGNY
jgi:hypothetical protein